MFSGHAKPYRSGKISRVGRSAMRKLLGTGNRRLHGIGITQPGQSAMLCQLLIVHGVKNFRASSFGQLMQDFSPFFHDAARLAHLHFKFRALC